jgi:hypothetical protein
MATRAAFVAVPFLLGALAAPASAQNFIKHSPETINRGNFKVAAFPTALFGKGGGSDRFGSSVRLGYGITDSFDLEGKAAFFDGFSLVGFEGEVWLIKGRTNASLSAGAHKALLRDSRNTTAINLTGLVGRYVGTGSRFEVYGGTSVSFESVDGVPGSGFTRAYVVPGIEYKLARDLDFVAEFGVGLNDDSPNYFGLGFALYLR